MGIVRRTYTIGLHPLCPGRWSPQGNGIPQLLPQLVPLIRLTCNYANLDLFAHCRLRYSSMAMLGALNSCLRRGAGWWRSTWRRNTGEQRTVEQDQNIIVCPLRYYYSCHRASAANVVPVTLSGGDPLIWRLCPAGTAPYFHYAFRHGSPLLMVAWNMRKRTAVDLLRRTEDDIVGAAAAPPTVLFEGGYTRGDRAGIVAIMSSYGDLPVRSRRRSR